MPENNTAAPPAPSGSSTPVSSLNKASLPSAFQQPVAGSSTQEEKKKGGVFSSDGSFIERFKKLREDELERLKSQEAKTKAQTQQDRIKNRGRKRPPPQDLSQADLTDDSKKPKTSSNDSAYLKEVQQFKGGSMKDEGSGIKPLMH